MIIFTLFKAVSVLDHFLLLLLDNFFTFPFFVFSFHFPAPPSS